MGKSKLAPEKVRATPREAEAVELRAVGVSFAKIGEKLDMSESRAPDMVGASQGGTRAL